MTPARRSTLLANCRCHDVQPTMPSLRRSAISAAERPSSASTSSVCSPLAGANRSSSVGVLLKTNERLGRLEESQRGVSDALSGHSALLEGIASKRDRLTS